MNNYGVPNVNPVDPNSAGPQNGAYGNPGWGMGQNMRTPGYDAPYRPAYMGPNPYTAYDKPSLIGAAYQMSPLAPNQYWGNPVSASSAAISALSGKPMDSAMWVAQRIAMPIVGFAAGQRMFSATGASMGGNFMGGMGAELFGAGKIASGMGGFGRFAGGAALGYAGGMAITTAMDQAFIQPYIRSRQFSEDAVSSFSGMNLGFGMGNAMSGRGMSRAGAAGFGNAVNRAGMQDLTFSANQYGNIASLGMKAGLYDNVNVGQMQGRMRAIAEQVKVLVAISNDPSVQGAIESLSKLQSAGAGISNGAAVGAFRSMGNYASIAGTSVQHLMGTVGLQGQYMYQANGLTPYMGQIAAGQAYAGFASGQRTGLLSTAHLARLGGLDGATQNVLGGQIAAAATPYNQISMYNQYLGRGAQNSMVNTIGAFGASAAADPLSASGRMGLYGSALTSRSLGERGGQIVEGQIYQMLRATGQVPRGKNGQYSAEQAVAVMPALGMSPDQIQAFSALRMSQTDPRTLGLARAGASSQEQEQLRQVAEQYGSTYGAVGAGITGLRKAAKGFGVGLASPAMYAAQTVGNWGDSISQTIDQLKYGSTINRGSDSINVDAAMGSTTGYGNSRILNSLNADAAGGGEQGELARKIISSKLSGADSHRLLRQYLKASGKFDNALADMDGPSWGANKGSGTLSQIREALSRPGAISTDASTTKDMISALAKTDRYTNAFDSMKVIGQASSLASAAMAKGYTEGEFGSEMNSLMEGGNYSELQSFLKKSGPDKVGAIKRLLRQGLSTGGGAAAGVAQGMGSIEAAMKDPSSVTNDPTMIGRIRAAGGDRDKVGNILAEIAAGKAGSKTQVKTRDSAGLDALVANMDTIRSNGQTVAGAAEQSQSKFDWQDASSVMAALDSSAKIQLQAANINLEAANKNAGSFLSNLFGGSNNQNAEMPKK